MPAAGKAAEAPKFASVTELTTFVKGLLKPLDRIYLDGEISGWKVYPSGHAYFKVKDAEAQLPCVMFASALERCRQRALLRDGVKVTLYGRFDVYAPRGECQLVVLAARITGDGDLMVRFLELKERLKAEGIFDRPKRPLPRIPHHIGIVTSPAGAVIHDMATVLFRRFPNLHVTLHPVKVQGEGAAAEIAAALGRADGMGYDLVIVGRGGGSLEDLWCFNEEIVVRAVAAMRTPTISAVGHETDFSLCDFAADRRAGTPSIAAETAVPVLTELESRIDALRERLAQAPLRAVELRAQKTDQLLQRLCAAPQNAATSRQQRLDGARRQILVALRNAVAGRDQRLDGTNRQLLAALRSGVQRSEARLSAAGGKLDLLDPHNPLRRGYTLTLDSAGRLVRRAGQVAAGDRVVTRTAEGSFTSTVA